MWTERFVVTDVLRSLRAGSEDLISSPLIAFALDQPIEGWSRNFADRVNLRIENRRSTESARQASSRMKTQAKTQVDRLLARARMREKEVNASKLPSGSRNRRVVAVKKIAWNYFELFLRFQDPLVESAELLQTFLDPQQIKDACAKVAKASGIPLRKRRGLWASAYVH